MRFFYLWVLLLFPWEVRAQEERVETGVGSSGKVVVLGGTNRLRVAVAQGAEELMGGLDRVAGRAEGTALPIVVQLYRPDGRKPSVITRQLLRVAAGDGETFRLQVNVRLAQGMSLRQKKLNRTLLEMLLIERGLRNKTLEETGEEVAVPPWLVDGMGEAIEWELGRGDRRVYASLAEGMGLMNVSEVLEVGAVGEMDLLKRELFRASSGALVMALTGQAEGKKALKELLETAPSYQGEMISLLQSLFPEVNLGAQGLEKWWSLTVAKMGEKPLSESMTVSETEARLSEVLRLRLAGEGAVELIPLERWDRIEQLEQEERRMAVERCAALLTGLSYRCFPSYREVIAGYLGVLAKMVKGGEELEAIDAALSSLKSFREGEVRRVEKLRDLMDWFHLSSVQVESGEFEEYLRVVGELREGSPGDEDPVTKYVEKMQEVYGED